ncbi:hypothetical protein FHS42_002980 [Streptomyces zagrosensis]|uniref:Uncharacterized protein n=1 Tax=Streptomyces zagrosensis TaxID=1042984 RepID=A0A7W9UZ07_9ACTN|nr:hypothetical protein [Streptomyces zagrosensis]
MIAVPVIAVPGHACMSAQPMDAVSVSAASMRVARTAVGSHPTTTSTPLHPAGGEAKRSSL